MSTPGPGPAASTARPALARLIGPLPVDDFAAQIWSRRAFTRATPAGPDLTGLFTLADADELLSVRGLRTPFLRLAKDGVVQPAASFTGGGGVGAGIGDQVDPDRVTRLLDDGCTVVFQGLHRLWPAVIEFAATLTAELGHPLQVNGYLTPPAARGFAPHYDTHDVFVVQTAGTKHWTVHRPVVDSPAQADGWTAHRDAVAAAAAGEPELDRQLGTGDVLYLPRGWIHSARAADQMSLHLTVGVHPYTRRHLADAVIAELFGAHPLTDSLPVGLDVADPHAVQAALAPVRVVLAEALGEVRADQVAARLERRRAADTRPAPVRPAAQAAAAAAIRAGGPGRVRPRTACAVRVEQRLDGVRLVLGGRHLDFDHGHAAAVKALTDPAAAAGGLDPDSLPGLDCDAGRDLVARLLLEGALVPVPPT